MINNHIALPKREKQDYPPIPENIYQAELLDVNLEEKPKYKKPDEKELKLSFQFTILSGKDKDGADLRGRNIWKNYVPTYLAVGKDGPNWLYQILTALLNRDLSPEEEATMNTGFICGLVGKQVRLVVKNEKKDDKVFSNIANILASEIDYTRLTEEEKEKARVKKKDEPIDEETPISEIPF